ncbi:MAG: hypothetical protein RKP46_01075 [Candidatus Accumulibacter sp.]|uniref:hypothetical protein n=1 Tax=Accumulibacter sp. TaxID=2053492 RepID=UPI002879E421|nr:hypothetical protein [Accumulibacter sp.]MDS4012927.1 hypothetical protein [Accumulibacter sp.]
MKAGKKTTQVLRPGVGYSQRAQAAVQATTARVRALHTALAGKSFALLRRAPLLARPVHLVERAHDGLVANVYQVVDLANKALCGLAGLVEERYARGNAEQPPGALASRVQGALAGVFAASPAAGEAQPGTAPALRADGAVVAPEAAAVRAAWPAAGAQISVFIHGQGCDETAWQALPATAEAALATSPGVDFGQQLQIDFGYTPVYVRYRTDLPVSENAPALAALLEQLHAAWPHPESRLILLGHGMGGLLALAACEDAARAGRHWSASTDMVICLGAAQLASPAERLGQQLAATLRANPLARPGAAAGGRAPAGLSRIACRFLAGSLAEDIEHRFDSVLADRAFGPAGASSSTVGDRVQSAAVGRLGHREMLTDARVYRQIADWLAALAAPAAEAQPDSHPRRRKTRKTSEAR